MTPDKAAYAGYSTSALTFMRQFLIDREPAIIGPPAELGGDVADTIRRN
ncbi:hypothetical protein [Sinorhizobium sp. Sb3]|nr:hypothetical protein [Sinorhizobium sp. Sb3]KSV68392.1 hypothetical protein N183_31270 [Sinorhizobium sp. Sb3]